jgi:hypothetical protein
MKTYIVIAYWKNRSLEWMLEGLNQEQLFAAAHHKGAKAIVRAKALELYNEAIKGIENPYSFRAAYACSEWRAAVNDLELTAMRRLP